MGIKMHEENFTELTKRLDDISKAQDEQMQRFIKIERNASLLDILILCGIWFLAYTSTTIIRSTTSTLLETSNRVSRTRPEIIEMKLNDIMTVLKIITNDLTKKTGSENIDDN
jgi:hypothetical protein